MGGLGSGRKPFRFDHTVEDYLAIDMGMLRPQRIKPGGYASGMLYLTINDDQKTDLLQYEIHLRLESPYIRLHCNWITEKVDYRIFLTSTRPNYGGFRYWFSCPICSKRVWKLYLALGSKYFLCRDCQNLTYTSCRESHQDDNLIASIAAEAGLSIERTKRAMKNFQKGYY